MAEIVITANTEKDTLIVTIDGKKIPDVKEVRACAHVPYSAPGEDATPEVHVEIISGTKDEESEIVRTIMTTCSKEQGIEEKDEVTANLIKLFRL